MTPPPAPSFPNDFRPTHRAAAVHAQFGQSAVTGGEPSTEEVAIGGRVLAKRDMGKAGFAQLLDGTGKLQVHGRKDVLGDETFAVFKALRPGDVVGVRGTVFRTKTGELTISARDVRLLVKAQRSLPEKWHGLKDVETRYRRRYLDLVSNDEVRRAFVTRARVIALVRAYLCERGFLEVETPMLQALPGGALARPFATHHNALDVDLYLRVAPELYLKRLVVGGLDRVFEIGRCFRNEGLSTRHNPEFTMLEFYQGYATYEDLLDGVEALFAFVAAGLHREGLIEDPERLTWGEHSISLARPFRRVRMRESVAERLGVPIEALHDAVRMRELARAQHVPVDGEPSAGELVLAFFEHLFEAELVNPTFVVGFPVETSPLARRNDADPSLVDRFELYVGGREIANGFSELNDPADQRERFLEQVAGDPSGLRRIDDDYVLALEHGLPPTAGCGIGIDRLVMLFTGAVSIRDVLLFPQLKPELPGAEPRDADIAEGAAP